MIASFKNRDTERIALGESVPRFWAVAAQAHRKLYLIPLARQISDLAATRGNRLEKLHGDREGQWSIRINNRWRICFEWRSDSAFEVEIVDYH